MDYMKIRTTLVPRTQPDGTILTDKALLAAAADLRTKHSVTTPDGRTATLENVRVTKRGVDATLTYTRYQDEQDLFLEPPPDPPQLPEPSLEVRTLRKFLADLEALQKE